MFYDSWYEVCIWLVCKIDVLILVKIIGYCDLCSLVVYFNLTVDEIVDLLDVVDVFIDLF